MSPSCANLKRVGDDGRLPPVLFKCGTMDSMLEDIVLGAVVKLYSEAPHRF